MRDVAGEVGHVAAETGLRLAVDIGSRRAKVAWVAPGGEPRLLPAHGVGESGWAPTVFYLPKGNALPLVGEDALRQISADPLGKVEFTPTLLGGGDVRRNQRLASPRSLMAAFFDRLRLRTAETVGEPDPNLPLIVSAPPGLSEAARSVVSQAAQDAGFRGAEYFDLPAAQASAWACSDEGTQVSDAIIKQKARILAVDVGACGVHWATLRYDPARGFALDPLVPPGSRTGLGAEDVEAEMLDRILKSMGPDAADAVRASLGSVLDDLRRAKEALSAGRQPPRVIVDGHEIRVDAKAFAEASAAAADGVSKVVAEQLDKVRKAGLPLPRVLLAGGGALTPGLKEKIAATGAEVMTWPGSPMGGALGALVLATGRAGAAAISELRSVGMRNRARRRRHLRFARAGTAAAVALLAAGAGWVARSDQISLEEAQATLRADAPITEASVRTEAYLSGGALRWLAWPFADLPGRRDALLSDTAAWGGRVAARIQAELSGAEAELRFPPVPGAVARLRSLANEANSLAAVPGAAAALPVAERASSLADLAAAAGAAEAARQTAATAILPDGTAAAIDMAEVRRRNALLKRLRDARTALASFDGTSTVGTDGGTRQSFGTALAATELSLFTALERRWTEITCADVTADMADPAVGTDREELGKRLADLRSDQCSGAAARLKRDFPGHQALQAQIGELRRAVAPLVAELRMTDLREAVASGWRNSDFGQKNLDRFGTWLDASVARAEDGVLRRLPKRIGTRAERDRVANWMVQLQDVAQGFSLLPYHRPEAVAAGIRTLENEIARVDRVLASGARTQRAEFMLPDQIKHPQDPLRFACANTNWIFVIEVRGMSDGSLVRLATKDGGLFPAPPQGFTCPDQNHGSWARQDTFRPQTYRIKSPLWTGTFDGSFTLSEDEVLALSNGGTLDLKVPYNYVLKLFGNRN